MLLRYVKVVIKKEDMVKVEEAKNQRSTVFKVEANAFQNVSAPPIYQNDLRVERLKEVPVAACDSLW